MHKVLLIVCREYLVRVRTKAFVIFTLLMPLFMSGMLLLPGDVMMRGTGTKHIAIVTEDRTLAEAMEAELRTSRVDDEENAQGRTEKMIRPDFDVSIQSSPTEALRRQLTTQVRDGNLDGFVWLEANAAATRKGVYYSRNSGDFLDASLVGRALRFALSERELSAHGFSAGQTKKLLGPIDLDTVHIDKEGSNPANGMGAFLLPFLLLISIYMTVFIYGIYVMRSVIEEKSSRVVEVLLGSVTPLQLMAGKIIGVGAVGLTQIAIWAAGVGIFETGSVSITGAMVGESMKDAHVSTTVLLLFPVFFVLGYATYACLYAAIGAMVNSDEEAQQLQFPVSFPLILCIVLAMPIVRDPNGPLAFWLSMFPLTAPMIMFVRAAVSMPPAWQIALSIGISVASLYGLVWLSSRIYRVGILMYGKRPTLPEILKWIRYA